MNSTQTNWAGLAAEQALMMTY